MVEGLWEPSSVEPPVSGMVPTEFAHEVGHNQGLDHNCEEAGQPGKQATSYAYGWRFAGNSGPLPITISKRMTRTAQGGAVSLGGAP